MEYSKEFLSQFKVDATNYTYVPVDNQPHVVPLVREGTTKSLKHWYMQKNHLYEHFNVQQYNVI